MDLKKVPCSVCGKELPFSDIIVTVDGLFCSQDLPSGVSAHFFTVHLSLKGMFALLAHLEGNPDVDQLFIVDAIKEKLQKQVVKELRQYVSEVQIPYSESLGEGTEEH